MNNIFMLKKKNKQSGVAMILSVIFFLFVSLSIIVGVVNPLFAELKISDDAIFSKQSYFLAESGLEDVFYRLKSGMSTSATEVLIVGEMEVVTEIVDVGNNTKEIVSQGNVFNHIRQIGLGLTAGSGASFNYGVETGNGGLEISGGGIVHGNVFANGPIVGNGTITGSAVSAGQYELVPIISSSGNFPPEEEISFGYQNTFPQDVAQSFINTNDEPIKRIRLYIKKSTSGWMKNIVVRIVNDNNGVPGKTKYGEVNISYGEIPTSYNYVTATFSNSLNLNSGTKYWIVLDTEGTWSERYTIGASSNSFAGGDAMRGSWSSGSGGSWSQTSPAGLDMYFDFYGEGESGLISQTHVGDDAWAYEIEGAEVSGNIYCQIGLNNNKLCDTTRPNPEPLAFSITDSVLDEWKNSAVLGGETVGNVSINFDGGTLGPRKIVGNLSVGSGALVLEGPIWVTGTVSLGSGGSIVSSNPNESRIIISDSTISVNGGGHADGTENSYILLVTTSTSDSAINLSGGAGAAVVSAPYGTVSISGGGDLKAASAWKIKLSGGGDVYYESGLINETFTSGPSGAWTISNWQEE